MVYLHERNEATGAAHPTRILISERKLVRLVTAWENGHLVTKKYVTRGPIASISTTTKNRLEVDDETRHISLWIDESAKQTRDILRAYGRNQKHPSKRERRVWRMVHRLLERHAATTVCIPTWFEKLADHVFDEDVRVRRYFPAFVEACKAVRIIRSFQAEASSTGTVMLTFEDFAIAALIFDEVFVESIHRVEGQTFETANVVREISNKNNNAPIQARDLARRVGISLDRAYERLRDAESAGVVRRANKPEKGNRKFFVAASRPRFIPDPKEMFWEIPQVGNKVKFVHPITGEHVIYQRKGRNLG